MTNLSSDNFFWRWPTKKYICFTYSLSFLRRNSMSHNPCIFRRVGTKYWGICALIWFLSGFWIPAYSWVHFRHMYVAYAHELTEVQQQTFLCLYSNQWIHDKDRIFTCVHSYRGNCCMFCFLVVFDLGYLLILFPL